jgi:hypothetical protein
VSVAIGQLVANDVGNRSGAGRRSVFGTANLCHPLFPKEDAMNNPKTRDDDERSSIANQKRENQMGTEKEARRVVEGGEADQQGHRPGHNRTPDKTIGQVKYADDERGGEQKKQGGSTRTTTPEKQGGIGGP